jgi:hypothetical protein
VCIVLFRKIPLRQFYLWRRLRKLPKSNGSRHTAFHKIAILYVTAHAGFLLGLSFNSEIGSSMFLRSIGDILPDKSVLNSRTYSSVRKLNNKRGKNTFPLQTSMLLYYLNNKSIKTSLTCFFPLCFSLNHQEPCLTKRNTRKLHFFHFIYCFSLQRAILSALHRKRKL